MAQGRDRAADWSARWPRMCPENWNDKKAFQLDSLLMAEAFWTEVQSAGGVDPGYGRTGRLQPIGDDHALELARARTQARSISGRGAPFGR